MHDPHSTAEAPFTAAHAEATDPPPPPPTWRRALGIVLRVVQSRFFKLGFVLLMVILGVHEVLDQWSEFKSGIDRLGLMATFEALLCVLAGLWLNLEVWRTLLAAAGSKISTLAACRIYFIGQLGKYMPGSVWPIVTQMELGRAYRVPRQRSATVAMLAMMIGLTSALLATVVGLPFMAGGKAQQYWWVFLFIPVTLVCLHPKVLNPVIARGLRIIRRPELEAPLTGRTIVRAVVINLAGWFFNGLQIWVLTARLGVHGGDTLLASTGAYALAWAVGFLIVFLPAGAGIREAILVATLSPIPLVGVTFAYAIALTSRLVTILGDLIGAGIVALISRRIPAPSVDEGSEQAEDESTVGANVG